MARSVRSRGRPTCPVGAGEHFSNAIDIEPGRVGADGEIGHVGFQ